MRITYVLVSTIVIPFIILSKMVTSQRKDIERYKEKPSKKPNKCKQILNHIWYVLCLYFGYNIIGDEYTQGKKESVEAENYLITKVIMVIFEHLPNFYIQMFEFLYIGYTHNYLVFAGLTSLTIFINFYMSCKKLQELILATLNANVAGKEH